MGEKYSNTSSQIYWYGTLVIIPSHTFYMKASSSMIKWMGLKCEKHFWNSLALSLFLTLYFSLVYFGKKVHYGEKSCTTRKTISNKTNSLHQSTYYSKIGIFTNLIFERFFEKKKLWFIGEYATASFPQKSYKHIFCYIQYSILVIVLLLNHKWTYKNIKVSQLGTCGE